MKNNFIPFLHPIRTLIYNKKLCVFFITMVMSSSALAVTYNCGDPFVDHFFVDAPSAYNACLQAEANRNNTTGNVCSYAQDLSSQYGRAIGYRCYNMSGAQYYLVPEDPNRYAGKFVQADGLIRSYIDPNSCVAPDIYNSITDACEGDNSQQCTVDEYYKPSTNQCITTPVCPDNYSFDTSLEECYLNTIDPDTPVGTEKVFYRTYPDWVDGPYVVDPSGGVWEVTDQISYGDQIGDTIVVKVIKTDLTDIPAGEYDWRMDYDDIDPATGDPFINPNTAAPEEFSYEQFSLTNTYTSGPLFTETTKTSIVNGELETVETEVSTSTNSDTGTVTETTTTTTTDLGGASSSTSTTTETLLGGSAVVTQTSSAAQTGTESDDLPDSTIVGGNTCGNPPVCSGDVLLCGLIQQTYKTRCNIVQEITDGDDGGLAALQDGVTADLDSFGEGIISSFGETDALSDFNAAPSDLVAEFNNLFPVSACQDFTFSWKSSAFTLTCEKTALLRLIMAWAAGIYTLFALYTIAFQRTPDKV